MNTAMPQTGGRVLPRVLAILIVLWALAQMAGGAWLVSLKGSPYYVLAGLVMLAGAVCLWMAHRWTRPLFHVLLVATVAWALWETGGQKWGMIARVAFVAVVWLLVVLATRTPGSTSRGAVAAVSGVVVLAAGVWVSGLVAQEAAAPSSAPAQAASDHDWPVYGLNDHSTRFSPLSQITTANVKELEVAWTYRTGDLPSEIEKKEYEFTFEATPLKIGNSLYLCTPHSIVISLDAETGKELWRFDPKVDDAGSYIKACRGVSYYKADKPVAACPERIVAGTLDGRLIAVDAKTGQPCSDFGDNGQTSMLSGLGEHKKGMTFLTSAPFIIGDVALVGGWVSDSYSVGEPSGAIRAYNVVTGQFAWAWDMGRPGVTTMPGDGETFTKGTPNSWPPMSADPALGLVYLPMGNATPDYWGGHRNEMLEKYASSIVALDVKTGAPRWHFQTVHHDVWDFDVPSAAVLFDLKRDGETIPALAQLTKMGEIYVLDRRTGEPAIPVHEVPMPQGAPPGDWLSPTQPMSTVPTLRPPTLTENMMWGLTPLDQIMCRVMFRSYNHVGIYTPQSVKGTIMYPAMFGTTDWGGGTYDSDRGLLVTPSSYMPFVVMLVPREEADRRVKVALDAGKDPSTVGIGPQFGTPFGMSGFPMLSPLLIPCVQPPWGLLTAIDLNANKIAWQRPFGTGRDNGPMMSKVGLPVEIGVPSMGGPTSTKGGVTFIAATLDNYFRAYETATGKELWRVRLPAGGQSTPMTYWSAASDRQFVVLSAGGHGALMTKFGDYVIAYALPKKKE